MGVESEINQDETEEYQVEKIISFSVDPLRFRVRWLNYSSEEDTNETLEAVADLAALDDFEKLNPSTIHKKKTITLKEALAIYFKSSPRRKRKR